MKSQTARNKILIVEDEAVVAQDLRQQLAVLGHDPVAVAFTGKEALVLAEQLRPDLVLMDIKLPGKMDGIIAAQVLRKQFDLPVVYLTAYSDEALVQRAKLTEPFGYVIKPFVVRELGIVIEMALYKHRTEVALRENRERFQQLAETMPDAMVVAQDGRNVYANTAAAHLLGTAGPEKLVGLKTCEMFDPAHREWTRQQMQRILAGEKPSAVEDRLVRVDRSSVPVEISASLSVWQDRPALQVVIRDISERKQALQELDKQRCELYRMQRVQIMGEIASSLAHEVNQPLAGILFSAQAAQQFLENTAPDLGQVRTILADIVADSKRAGEVVANMRALLRKEIAEPGLLDINGVVEKTVAFLRKSLSLHDVVVKFDATDGLPPVHAIAAHVEQVIVNLLMNAEQAMGGLPNADWPAMLVVSTGRDASGQVAISVRDHGTGFAAAELARLFEPFHSTKINGLGMGLAISSSIVKAHGGRIWAENHPDGGAVVTFTLPAAEGECGSRNAERGMGNGSCE
jgi:PAS domain S-box-containing protein